MKTPSFILFFFVVIILFSCKKKDAIFDGVTCAGDCFIISGKVKDSADNTGIADAEVKIYYRFSNTGSIFPARTDYIGRAVADNNGNYTFRFNSGNYLNAAGYFYVEAFRGYYFRDPYNGNRFPEFYLETANVNVPYLLDLTMFRHATLKVKLVATNITDFSFMDVDYSYGAMSTGVTINGNGRKIDTLMEFKTAGDIATIIKCKASGNGVNIEKTDTVVVPSKGERTVEFRF